MRARQREGLESTCAFVTWQPGPPLIQHYRRGHHENLEHPDVLRNLCRRWNQLLRLQQRRL